ncbi:hypothetical protein F2Q69_00055241 [Brassica cretica]|uniref:Uncharacterized protein n=1 Tax=Brassica cretica TaxID=69181 RepID=A0A8S9MN49_BRACR|nr:hypothetical protein F2Q69_00055241 [Brassica cretica]
MTGEKKAIEQKESTRGRGIRGRGNINWRRGSGGGSKGVEGRGRVGLGKEKEDQYPFLQVVGIESPTAHSLKVGILKEVQQYLHHLNFEWASFEIYLMQEALI